MWRGMTEKLLDIIQQHIRKDGPMTIADYMNLCLGHADHGYYMTHDPLGLRGDFTTAPEISQMFGELIGAWILQCWHDLGEPSRFHLIEQGPGRGTLMADILRVTARNPKFMQAADIHLVEISPVLIEKQQKALSSHTIHWQQSFTDINLDAPFILIGNEFLDALPVHQFVWHENHWHERCIGLDAKENLTFVESAPSYDPRMLALEKPPGNNDILELCPTASALIEDVALKISEHGGAALYIDYGYSNSEYGDTLQALYRHEYCDALTTPGEADITAHVDFERLAKTAQQKGTKVSGPTPQGDFLKALGIELRARQLIHHNPAKAEDIGQSLKRLTDDSEMGHLFKVMAITHPDLTVAGFENVYV
jgi:NADH dehydrogenase [ubiquinone] 1 alpha subcomplex assembly factor 7